MYTQLDDSVSSSTDTGSQLVIVIWLLSLQNAIQLLGCAEITSPFRILFVYYIRYLPALSTYVNIADAQPSCLTDHF